jgi:Na+:H+ antiporter, NhaA family
MQRNSHQPWVADPVGARLFSALERFLHVEAAGGIVLLLAAAVALGWANSPWAHSYEALWHAPVTLGVGTVVSTQSLHFWINDGLMTIFFLVVGLEIRREIHEGALSTLSMAAVPLVAATGGVIVPALIYSAFNMDPVTSRGWAVPTATDIAFAVGILALLGKRVPPGVRVLLLALAIIDDIAAILVIAFFYSSGVKLLGLAIVAAGVLGVLLFQRMAIRSAFAYLLPGAVMWFGLLYAGVHPTLAGVALGLLAPVVPLAGRDDPIQSASRALENFRERAGANRGDVSELVQPIQELSRAQQQLIAPVLSLQAVLHPWVAYGIMPLFALANAGVSLQGLSFDNPDAVSIGLGVLVGLVIGKPLGIVLVTLLSARVGLCVLPTGVTPRSLFVVGCLGGIGFTMSIFISNLAFASPDLLAAAKLAVLVASLIAGVVGLIVGTIVFKSAAVSSSAH